jgi:hypothetical protein
VTTHRCSQSILVTRLKRLEAEAGASRQLLESFCDGSVEFMRPLSTIKDVIIPNATRTRSAEFVVHASGLAVSNSLCNVDITRQKESFAAPPPTFP